MRGRIFWSFPRASGGNPATFTSRAIHNLQVQIPPIRIALFDQSDFPFPLPFLDLCLAQNRLFHTDMELEVHEQVRLVFLAESFDYLVVVLPDALRQVAGYPGVQRAIALTRQDVNSRLFFIHCRLKVKTLDSRQKHAGMTIQS
jgi:hypothetical protein